MSLNSQSLAAFAVAGTVRAAARSEMSSIWSIQMINTREAEVAGMHTV